MNSIISIMGLVLTPTLIALGIYFSYRGMVTGRSVIYRYAFWFFCLQFVTLGIAVMQVPIFLFCGSKSSFWSSVLGDINGVVYHLAPAILVFGCYVT